MSCSNTHVQWLWLHLRNIKTQWLAEFVEIMRLLIQGTYAKFRFSMGSSFANPVRFGKATELIAVWQRKKISYI